MNRALLARQWLLERRDATPLEAIEHLVGLQAQNTLPPYLGLWSRLRAFEAEQLSKLLREHRVVRLALQRSTIHLVTARDALALRPLWQPTVEHHFHTGTPFARRLEGVDYAAVAAQAKKLLPRTTNEIGKLLGKKLKRDAEAVSIAVRTYLPLVQLPPRGIFGEGGQPVCDTLDSVLGKKGRAAKLDAVILRYLAAFGPATARDFQVWSGMRGVTFDGVRKKLVVLRDEEGRELFDLPDAPRPDEDVEAPPRLLGEYDNLALAHWDRSRVISELDRKKTFSTDGVKMAALIDGFVGATWRMVKGEVKVDPFRKLTRRQQQALDAEVERFQASALSSTHRAPT